MGAPSSYSKNLGLELIATGAKAGTWGTITNRNLDTLDDSINGMVEIPLGGTSYTLNTVDGAISPGHSKVLFFTGSPPGDCLITIAPDHREHVYYVVNETNVRLNFTQGTGGNFTLEPPYAAVIHCQGVGATSRVWGTLANFQVRNLWVVDGIQMSGTANATLNNATLFGTTVCNGPLTCQQGITVNSLVGSFNAGLAVAGNLGFSGPMTQTGSGLVRFTGLVHVDQLRVDTGGGGDTQGDMYVRGGGPNFALNRVPPGSLGNILTWTPSGPGWSSGGLTVNMPATGFIDRQILGVQSNQLRGTPLWWNTVWAGVSRVNGFAPLFAWHVWAPGGDKLCIDGDGSVGMGLRWAVTALMRWEWVLTEAEGGVTDSGSNLTLVKGTDTGAPAIAPMRVMRLDGNVLFGNTNPSFAFGQVNISSPDNRICLVLRVGPTAVPSAACLLVLRNDGSTAFIVNNNGDVAGKSFTVI